MCGGGESIIMDNIRNIDRPKKKKRNKLKHKTNIISKAIVI